MKREEEEVEEVEEVGAPSLVLLLPPLLFSLSLSLSLSGLWLSVPT